MTDKELLYVTTIAETKSISKAVALLEVNQSSLSRCVKKIETEYSIKLFYKNKKLLMLTPAGENYVEGAKKILARYDQLKKELSGATDSPTGILNIGTGIHHSHTFLPYLFPEFIALYPNIKVNLTETQTFPLNQMLENGQLDMIITYLPLMKPSFEVYPLFTENFLLTAPAGKIKKSQIFYKAGQTRPYIHLRSLKDQPFILGYHHQYSRVVCDEIFKKAGFTPNIRQLTRNMENARRLCATGLGYAILPESSARISHPQFETESFLLDEQLKPYWTMAAIYKSKEELPAAALVFLKLLIENARVMEMEQPANLKPGQFFL